MLSIRRVAVLGSGVMGAAIAGHLANVGIPSLLLDIVPTALTPDEEKKGLTLASKEVRNRLANLGRTHLLKAKPAPLYVPQALDLIETGNLDDDFDKLADCDWIIEVVVERLDVKRALLARVDAARKPGSIVSSNTSGVSITAMSQGRSTDFLKHFLGTHFFNPPRYMKLLEIIPTDMTDPDIVQGMCEFGERVLGKGVVVAFDTPNFIANRIGTFGLLATLEEMKKTSFGVDEVDLLTGPVLGRPKSATFRTLDIVGIDTFVHVAKNVQEQSTDEKEKAVFTVPAEVLEMVSRGWIGDKAGQGFFHKVKGERGSEILALDLSTMAYRPRRKLQSASFEAARQAGDLTAKVKALLYGDDAASLFLWRVISRVLAYSASLVGVIAKDIVAIDQAMKWGFNWELGPFELWDAIGVKRSVQRMQSEGITVPAFVTDMLTTGSSFYSAHLDQPTVQQFFTSSGYREKQTDVRAIDLQVLRQNGHLVMGNKGASLVDIGDGILALDFHSPKQAIGSDIVTMLMKAADETEKNYEGLVITSSVAPNFCVGANLMMILMAAQDEDYDEVELAVRQFQRATMRVKYMRKPVVAAPYGLTLGGGAEMCFPATRVQAAAETYMGLVETGVGLLPGGGGNKEMLIRAMERMPDNEDVSAMPFVQQAFERIALAKVSTSAADALELGYLRKGDAVTVSREQQLYDAKQAVLSLAERFVPRKPKAIRVVGEEGAALLKIGVYGMKKSGYISDHDEKVAKQVIRVLTGGNVAGKTLVSEDYLLDLEREAFLSLCAEPKTQARMAHTLKTGKPLRN
ncbi:MAG: 3-hydroxyacyl-CoA dehydrogenase NAD-binding domain-containing protein [Firmicutes bacterium]|nr:3-hydroxyacyl-CoA dehydrogenase NAD-binding domain-containing protein [Bacillota bacterium]